MATRHLTRLTVDLEDKDHQKLKTFAAITGKSMREIVISWIHDNLQSKNIPNKKTHRAIEKAQAGEGLEEIDLDDLL